MKHPYLALFFLLLSPFFPADAAAPAPLQSGAELLVKFRGDPAAQDTASVHASVGATLIRSFDTIGWQLVRLPEGISMREAQARYNAHPAVAAVEANALVKSSPPPAVETQFLASEPNLKSASAGQVIPNDPSWSSQWNMRQIGMPAAWSVNTGSTNIVIAIPDTGVDYTHEDLRDNMWRNPGESGLDANGKDKSVNGMDDDENGYVDDLYGIDTIDNDNDPMDGGFVPGSPPLFYHGTACAGIIAARGNNGRGVAGIAWDVKIMAVRMAAGTEYNMPWSTRTAAVLEAFEYILEQKRRGVNVRVTSNSWGAPLKSQAQYDIIERLGMEGILSVFGTYNEPISSDVNWNAPENYDLPAIISIAATDSSGGLANWAGYGPFSVDFAAPGDRVPTTSANRTYYSSFTGTSAAIPHAAGAAALLFSAKPDATPLEVKTALMQSTDKLSALSGKVATGGRLNVSRALEAITNNSLPVIVIGAFPASSHTEVDAEIELWFSAPMNRESVEEALVFNPAITGSIQWSEDSRVIRIKPDSALLRTNYSARLLGTATDQHGRTFDGDFDAVSEGQGSDDFLWGFSFGPENDNFASAMRLQGPAGTVTGSNVNASFEPDEPLPGRNDLIAALSLWYQWRASADGWVTFDSSVSSELETVLAVYSGSSLDALQELGYGDSWGARRRGRISLPVQAGENYFLTVAGRSFFAPGSTAYRGAFRLSWYPTPAPTLTAGGFSPTSAIPGTKVNLIGTNFTGATEVLFNGGPAQFTTWLTNYSDLRITATVPPDATDGPITIRTPHGDVASTAEFVVLPPPLTITRIPDGAVEVSWPATGPAFALESCDRLGNPWEPVDLAPGANGRTAHAGDGGAAKFYRLRKR